MKGNTREILNIRALTTVLSVILLIGLPGCNGSGGPDGKSSAAEMPVPSIAKESAAANDDKQEASGSIPSNIYEKLKGRWIRTDGNYAIEVFSVDPAGKVDAGYFNPGPINVEKSEWKISDNKLYFRVILKDVNYPGSTYTLMYNSENDQLTGNYFQAVEGINYEVAFRRMNEK